ncbi:thiolase-like protein [Glonium stellatum]|uniref:propanoyl-CoA C-acyltransferase n=1 Tax=Glonium stellatum TaxID=574774 RepID=A0A8E2JQV8_9PEZI|nr:thiolase-like protein [Glonium stellatum]
MTSKGFIPAYVVGVGLTKFIKPRGERDYPEMGYEAGIKAMLDAKINYDEVETGVACYCYGDTTSGQRIFYQFGMTGIPIYNTNNACATGSTGLHLARTLVKNGVVDCALVIGFEKMQPGSIKSVWSDRPSPMGLSVRMMADTRGITSSPPNAQFFGNAGREYMEKYGATEDDFAEIARISHEHSQRNPYAQFRQKYTLDEIKKSPVIYAPLTKLQCSPTSDGAGAAVIVSQKFLDSHPELKDQAILIAGQALMTDLPKLYSRSAMDLVGFDMTAQAAKAAMNEAGVSPKDIKVCEMHDCFSANELITLDGLGLSEPGKAHEMVRRGDITYGGKVVINPSGGLISKGHPLGATGLAQCAELVWQLRGWANNRFVPDASVALQHNLGLGGAAVVTVYKKADGSKNRILSDEQIKKSSLFEYNPAVEARYVTEADADKVRSKNNRNEYALGDTLEKLSARL